MQIVWVLCEWVNRREFPLTLTLSRRERGQIEHGLNTPSPLGRGPG